jgi:hypothetical protein
MTPASPFLLGKNPDLSFADPSFGATARGGPWRRSGKAEPDLCGGGGWLGAVGEGGQRGSYGL